MRSKRPLKRTRAHQAGDDAPGDDDAPNTAAKRSRTSQKQTLASSSNVDRPFGGRGREQKPEMGLPDFLVCVTCSESRARLKYPTLKNKCSCGSSKDKKCVCGRRLRDTQCRECRDGSAGSSG
jgi:hypothetical protein